MRDDFYQNRFLKIKTYHNCIFCAFTTILNDIQSTTGTGTCNDSTVRCINLC